MKGSLRAQFRLRTDKEIYTHTYKRERGQGGVLYKESSDKFEINLSKKVTKNVCTAVNIIRLES